MLSQTQCQLKHSYESEKRLSTIGQSTVLAHRVSIHFQNILTPLKQPKKYLDGINHHVALFREMLITLGQEKDCPELREKIRKLRCTILEECKLTAQILMPKEKSEYTENIVVVGENRCLILFFLLLQLFFHELVKSHHLIQTVPMDMNNYFENRTGPSNLGNVISEILLCKQITPDFTMEELSCIQKASQEIQLLIKKIQKFVPQESNSTADIQPKLWPLKRKIHLFGCSLF